MMQGVFHGRWRLITSLIIGLVIVSGLAFYLRSSISPRVLQDSRTAETTSMPEASRLDSELPKASADMVVPYGTPLALQVDPRRLRALMDQGEAAYRSGAGEVAQAEGARLIQISAALGYGPARRLTVRDYPRVRLMRMVTPSPDVVRYALDAFTGGVAASAELERAFGALVIYFADRKELAALATHLIEAIRDDTRLQFDGRLALLFDALSQVDGACPAIARAVAAARSVAECRPELMQQVITRARAAGVHGREIDSRRNAMWLMEQLNNDTDPGLGSSKPAVRVLPGFFSVPVTDKIERAK
jgi:hypothetical protein